MKYFILILSALLLLSACGTRKPPANRYTAWDNILDYAKPVAFGEDDDVHVFCGNQSWSLLEPLLRGSIERSVSLVIEERYFNLILSPISEINRLMPYKNLVFIGDLEGNDDVSQYMRANLASNYIDRVNQSGGDLFIAKNKSSRDQLILYLLATNKDQLQSIARLQAGNIFSLLLKRYGERLAYQAFRGKVIEASFWEHFPFSMQVPDSFRLYANNSENRFLSLLYRSRMESRDIPDKYISIYYEDMDSDEINPDWIIARRNEIWGALMDGDTIPREKLRSERFNFAGYKGWRLIGPWENHNLIMGGAFQSVAFWHPESKRAYIVDNSVYFPAGEKLSILLELYMISSTLVIK